ncbi:enoyl-CoA hydratase/isomerase family protein [Gordonia terrae]|uniref:enoyl-CoA hydratase/isomerase family protein n=1 Tax=Gordonia terrae TaxID=2055 RepID=UPI003F6B325E
MTTTLHYRDKVAVLTLGADENRFSPERLSALRAQLDEIEHDAQGLITVGTGKFYSNGLDLEWLLAHPDEADDYVDQVQRLFVRLLTFPLPTVAAVNGHAFGAGAMFALAHDFRVMRQDRGYYCFPEVDINIPFTAGMAALIQSKLSPQAALEAMTTGRRYGGADARSAGLVDDTAAEDSVVDVAMQRLSPILGKDPGTVAAIKSTMFAAATDALERGRAR